MDLQKRIKKNQRGAAMANNNNPVRFICSLASCPQLGEKREEREKREKPVTESKRNAIA
jgi:hypothetical protein